MPSPSNNITSVTFSNLAWQINDMSSFFIRQLNESLDWPTEAESKDGQFTLGVSAPNFNILRNGGGGTPEVYMTPDPPSTDMLVTEDWVLSDVQVDSGGSTVDGFTLTWHEDYPLSSGSDPAYSSLQELLNRVHAIRTPDSLSSQHTALFNEIKQAVKQQEDIGANGKNYYYNHTGRELYRKLFNYGLSELISTSYDSGFRPDAIDLSSIGPIGS